MKYSYIYKTSDGVRSAGEIESASREDAFSQLRARGIRPIKVVAADGSKANGEVRGVRKRVAVAGIVAAAVLAAGVAFLAARRGGGALDDPPPSAALAELRVRATAVAVRHRAALELAGGSPAKIRQAVAETRAEAREVFKDIMRTLPDARERQEAKRLYGELMMEADDAEFE